MTHTFKREEFGVGKFAGSTTQPVRANLAAPVATTAEQVPTFNGGDGWARTAESDLFLLAVTNIVGEDTFYEAAGKRDSRYVDLIRSVTATNPAWVAGFVGYLRETMLMRSASIVLAAEYVKAGGPNGRALVDAACQRPDEPAEMIAYWHVTHGRRLPMAVKRGVADAVRRLYTERAVLRYDGKSKALRFADVIELVHPKPVAEWQSTLFRYLLDLRHHDEGSTDGLPTLEAAAALEGTAPERRRSMLADTEALSRAGFSWERLSGWLPGGMDAEAWEAVIPSMGVMALLRNLRNFDQAAISEQAIDTVIARVTDAEEVAKARIFPYRVWAAYREAPSDNWRRALATTLTLAAANVPRLDGTLVLIDTSGSMQGTMSGRSTMQRVEVAALMAATMAHRAAADLVIFGQYHAPVPAVSGRSVLQTVDHVRGLLGSVGHATYGHTAIAAHFDPARHKRVVMFTDDQQHDAGHVTLDHVPLIYTVDLAGYAASSLQAGEKGRYTLGGFTDATFAAMAALEAGRDARWPWT